MDDGWVCASCHSINQSRTSRCYSCRQGRATGVDATIEPGRLDRGPNGGALEIPAHLQDMAKKANATIFTMPSVPGAIATLEQFNDFDLPGITDLPSESFQLTPDVWAAASGIPAERIDSLADASIPIWQLIGFSVGMGDAAAVQDLLALFRRRLTAVRLSELGRAVDRVAALMSPDDLGRLASEGETVLAGYCASGGLARPVPPDTDPAMTALGNRIESIAQVMSTAAREEAGSPMVAYVRCYRQVTESQVRSFRRPDEPSGAAERNGILSLGGVVPMTCPQCGAPRVFWSDHCKSCGLGYDAVAVAEVMVAASEGGGALARLLLRRLVVLIPGLLLLLVFLVFVALVRP